MASQVLDFLVDPSTDGQRLDTFIAQAGDFVSRSACVKLIEAGLVTINGTAAQNKSERVMLGDRIRVVYDAPDNLQEGVLRPNPYIELDIRFEDEYLMVLSKQAGLVCHPSPGHVDDTLANALVSHCGYGHLGMLQGEDRPGIVHRLDMDTSGLMVAAKDDHTQKCLQDLIRLRTLDRRYVVLVQGYVSTDKGTIETGIARSTRNRLSMTVSDDPMAREAITTFRTLERFEAGSKDEGYSLLECHLYTGRTHQIRVHMRHIGHQVVGDQLYGKGSLQRNLGLNRQFLHSWHIRFSHPILGETIEMADWLPTDLVTTLQSIQGRSLGKTEAGEKIIPQLFTHDWIG
ncbi:RluA family pseudouridine synthase [Atopobium fossor]|uniref:RluA family pseudouridine synthase n=1 Tax=Atopobium fossor TaxID=39487 RepID=UPI0003F4CEEF|nr:RluA family pseudouridine synthase [Atopobium fossor]